MQFHTFTCQLYRIPNVDDDSVLGDRFDFSRRYVDSELLPGLKKTDRTAFELETLRLDLAENLCDNIDKLSKLDVENMLNQSVRAARYCTLQAYNKPGSNVLSQPQSEGEVGMAKIMAADFLRAMAQVRFNAFAIKHRRVTPTEGGKVRFDVRLFKHFLTFRIQVDTVEDLVVGKGVYPLASLFNHSCEPSCIVAFEGSRLIVTTSRAVAAGDALTISYGPLKSRQCRKQRQAELLSKYGFECQCEACNSDEPDSDASAWQGYACKCGGCAIDNGKNIRCSKCGDVKANAEAKRKRVQELVALKSNAAKFGEAGQLAEMMAVVTDIRKQADGFLHQDHEFYMVFTRQFFVELLQATISCRS